jgi:hypothetical protein
MRIFKRKYSVKNITLKLKDISACELVQSLGKSRIKCYLTSSQVIEIPFTENTEAESEYNKLTNLL